MAINALMVHWFQHLYEKKIFQVNSKLLELGPQDLHESVSVDVIRQFIERKPVAANELLLQKIMEAKTSKELYKMFGIVNYKSSDYFDRRADYSFDLNYVSKTAEKFDIITNFGTAEHCFNIAAVFETIHNFLDAGGIALHVLPAYGDVNHGFYNIHPIVYTSIAQSNQYNVVDFVYADNMYTRAMEIFEFPHNKIDFECFPIRLSDFQDHHNFRKKVFYNYIANCCGVMSSRHNACQEANVFDYCFVALQKVFDKPFVFPSQY